MNYTPEQKRILRRERFDSFATGYRKGCCWSIAASGILFFLAVSMCSNKPIENIKPLEKEPSLVKKGDIIPTRDIKEKTR